MKRILIFGATSTIAHETAKLLTGQGASFFLVGRQEARLKILADDLKVRGAARTAYAAADLNDFDQHAILIQEAERYLLGLDLVLIAHGTLNNQHACERDYAATEQALQTNFLSVVSLLTHLANRLEQQKGGCLVVISSVAGDCGRRSNYIYGTAKGAVSLFLQGLRSRLHPQGVRVITIKPGPVDTPMTAHLAKTALFVGPDTVAKGIIRAINQGHDVSYVPAFWRVIMFVLNAIPECWLKRLNL